MTSILQLKPSIRVYTPFGPGVAKFLRVEDDEADMIWTVFLENNVIVDVPNHKVRAQKNWTAGRLHANHPPEEPIQNLTGHAAVE